MQFTESRYTKQFWSYKHLLLGCRFPEQPQRVQQTWKKNDLKVTGASLLIYAFAYSLFIGLCSVTLTWPATPIRIIQ